MRGTVAPSLEIEADLWHQGYELVAGIDEAGRGCLAGPVVAAAVILPHNTVIDGVDDSKKLSADAREESAGSIRDCALSVSVGVCSPDEIDRLNILWAAMEAMRRAVFGLRPRPDYLLFDGDRAFPGCEMPHQTVVRGDGRCHAIAAASIIAKTERDRMMKQLHDDHPEYHWVSNVGYPTAAHYDALAAHGPTPHHRQTFRLIRPAGA